MRRFLSSLAAVPLLVFAVPAMAQTTSNSSFNVSWSALDPGNDWAAQIIQNIFPVSGSGGAWSTQTTVIAQMVGQLTGFVAAIAMAYLCYATIMQIYRGAETSRLLSNNMSSFFAVRLGFAAIMMFPIPGVGFSVGQAAVVKMSLWGVGMASAVYKNAVQALGPEGMVIAQPMVPGTETIVLGLIQNELCRSMANVASNTVGASTQLVPEPTGVTIASGNGTSTVYDYNLSVGNVDSAPSCGAVTIATPQATTTLAGVSVNQAAIQQQALTTVLQNDIAGPVQTVAQALFSSRKTTSLEALQSILTTATRDYNAQLTTAAQNITQSLTNAITASNKGAAPAETAAEQTALNQGWTAAGAYYLEFAKLNGQTLSLLSAVPQLTPPSYAGFGPSLSSDLAPLIQSAQAFMATLQAEVDTQDNVNEPAGNDLIGGATPGTDGSGVISQVFRSLNLNDYILRQLETAIAPTSSTSWTDPFAALMGLGNTLVTISISAMGLAAIASSKVATAASATFSALSGNIEGSILSIGAHMSINFLATPIFALILALLIPGLTIAFVLPMIPWVMWMAGVMGWIILVCEAVIAVPLWMLAHMTMQGEGLHGKAAEGYALLFNVIFRPTLMLFGLFLGYFVFAAMSLLIRETFGIAAGFVLEGGWFVSNFIGIVVLISIFVMTHVIAALAAFRMISLVPHHVPRLIGFDGANRVDIDQFSKDAAIVGVGGALTAVNQGMRNALSNANQSSLAAPQGKLTGPESHGGNGVHPSGPSNPSPGSGGMDTTTRAATDVPPPSNEEL